MTDVFKVKKTRDSQSLVKSKEHMGTLDSLHQNYIEELRINTSNSKIDELTKDILVVESQLENLSNDIFDFDTVFKRSLLEKQLKELKDTHEKTKDNKFITQYYIDNADIMLDYYTQTKKNTSSLSSVVPIGSLTTFDKLFHKIESCFINFKDKQKLTTPQITIFSPISKCLLAVCPITSSHKLAEIPVPGRRTVMF